jgi:hypothetical protein
MQHKRRAECDEVRSTALALGKTFVVRQFDAAYIIMGYEPHRGLIRGDGCRSSAAGS